MKKSVLIPTLIIVVIFLVVMFYPTSNPTINDAKNNSVSKDSTQTEKIDTTKTTRVTLYKLQNKISVDTVHFKESSNPVIHRHTEKNTVYVVQKDGWKNTVMLSLGLAQTLITIIPIIKKKQ